MINSLKNITIVVITAVLPFLPVVYMIWVDYHDKQVSTCMVKVTYCTGHIDTIQCEVGPKGFYLANKGRAVTELAVESGIFKGGKVIAYNVCDYKILSKTAYHKQKSNNEQKNSTTGLPDCWPILLY